MTVAHSLYRRPSGFTLIEILVVVSIIALLISILLPSLVQAHSQARTAACMSNLHQFGIAFGLYGVDNRYRSPRNAVPGTPGMRYEDSDWWYYPHMIAKYLPTNKTSQSRAGFLGVFACPADLEAGRAYAMNAFENGRQGDGTNGNAPVNLFRFELASRYLLLGEANAIFLDTTTGLYGARHLIGQGKATPYSKFRTLPEMGDRGPFSGHITFRHHSRRANFLLCDLSVRSLRLSQVVDDPRTRSRMEVWWVPDDVLDNPPPP